MDYLKKLIAATTLLLGALACNATYADSEAQCKHESQLSINQKTAYIEVADTEKERRYGLMFRRKLGADCGMIFIFADEQYRVFTMRNTLIPLDIAFITTDGKIAEVFTMQPGVERYPSSVRASYALEMNAGWFDKNDIAVGDKFALLLDGSTTDLKNLRQ